MTDSDFDRRFDAMLRPGHGYRLRFAWVRPRLTSYRAADRRPIAFMLNRYPGIVIGMAAQFGQRVISLVWGRPNGIAPGSCRDCALDRHHLTHTEEDDHA